MSNNLYVGNLPFSATEDDVTALFSKYGALKKVSIIKDAHSGKPKGFGFVEFINSADAQRALELDGKEFSNRALKVNVAKPKEAGGGRNQGSREGNRGRNFGNSRDRRW